MNKRTMMICALLSAAFFVPITSDARWLNPNTGRFQTMDTFEGNEENPQSLHKYTYAENNPVSNVDPSGHESIGVVMASLNIVGILAQISNPVTPRAQQRAQQLLRPSSAKFWPAYLNYNDYAQQEVWKKIGGGVGKEYGTPTQKNPEGLNSCAARVSYGLNYGGAPIPRGAPDAGFNYEEHVYAGKRGDKKYYIVKAGKMNEHLTKAWGRPDATPRSVPELDTFKSSLKDEQVAVFATKNTPGHSGVLRKGYNDPFVGQSLPVDAWKLLVP